MASVKTRPIPLSTATHDAPWSFLLLERLRNENEDKPKTQMTQSFNQYSENETKIWCQNILNQFNHMSSPCLRNHYFV